MSDEAAQTVWEGRYLAVKKQGRWEYVARTRGIGAVVILAEHDGRLILVEQHRVPLGRRCLELPAGLVGDEQDGATIEETAIKELEEEAGFACESVEILGQFYSSPGMVAEGFTLVRAHGVRKVGDGGGTEHEDIEVHLVPRQEIRAFIEGRRADDVAIDVKLLLFHDF